VPGDPLTPGWASVEGAKRIPMDEAIELVRFRAELYTPDKTGGDLPRSLGHPWFSALLIVEWKRILVDRRQLKLPLLSVESNEAAPETIAAAMQEFKQRWAEK